MRQFGGQHGRLKLLARLQRQRRIVTEPLVVGQLSWPFTRVANPDQVLVEMERQSNSTWQPYWVEVWSSGRVLAEQLERCELAQWKVLDLGCGLGTVGAVAAARGARVLMVDAAPPALLFARLNSWPWRKRVATRRLDWRCDTLGSRRFRLIVGADILYERSEWEYLEPFWRRHLERGGQVLLGEPGRRVGDEFERWLHDRGWQVETQWTTDPAGQRVRVMRAAFCQSDSAVRSGKCPAGH